MSKFYMEVYEGKIFNRIFSFSSGQKKLSILQYIWFYIIISISKEIRPMLRLSYISVCLKSFLTFYKIIFMDISQYRSDLLTNRNDDIKPNMLSD